MLSEQAESKHADQRSELGAFLRSRRERITPEDVGLPPTGRRRTPGLRREELALLAGISATWYTYLEQGRDIRASDQVLTALAAVLRLDRHERGHLFQLAGHARPSEEPESLPAEVAGIPLLLQPHPAYIIDGNYDVLSHNQAARDIVADWAPEARGLLARLRMLAGRHPGDPRYTRLIDELTEHSPEFRTWWPQYDVQAQRSGRKRLRHKGTVTDYAYTAFHLAEQPDQTLVIYRKSAAAGDEDLASVMTPSPASPANSR